jgi:hypothetical protein
MKKFLVTILAFVYLSTSMGAIVHLHYCMGKLVSWGLIDKDSKNCLTCGMSKKSSQTGYLTAKMGCCEDKQLQVKTEKDQKLVQSESQDLKFLPEGTSGNFQTSLDFYVFSITMGYPNANAPPQIGKVPVFLLNRNFRI